MTPGMGTAEDEHDRDVTFRVDRSLFDGRYAVPREVYGSLDRLVRTDLHFHYSTPICAQRWLDVCDDPAYGHDQLLARITDAFPGLVDALTDDGGSGAGIAVTSLGPGDGSIDERILEAVAESVGVHSYRALDFSFELLRRAVHRLAHSPRLPRDFTIEAICGDFTDLREVGRPTANGARHLFLLTGLTLGNYPEDHLLGRIGSILMAPGDYLLLDARSHGLPAEWVPDGSDPSSCEPLTRSYDLPTVRRFVLGPVEVATAVAPDGVEVGYDVVRTLTRVPGAWNVAIHARDFDATVRLTGERVRRSRLDLAITTLYDTDRLRSWFPGVGFTPVWSETRNGTAFFLLRRG